MEYSFDDSRVRNIDRSGQFPIPNTNTHTCIVHLVGIGDERISHRLLSQCFGGGLKDKKELKKRCN